MPWDSGSETIAAFAHVVPAAAKLRSCLSECCGCSHTDEHAQHESTLDGLLHLTSPCFPEPFLPDTFNLSDFYNTACFVPCDYAARQGTGSRELLCGFSFRTHQRLP